MSSYKLVVYVPLEKADHIRQVIGEAGGGKLGKYSFCTFSTKGVGRFKPNADAKPHIGNPGKLEEVQEERIEVTCGEKVLNDVITAIKRVHPYEEVAMDVWKLGNHQ